MASLLHFIATFLQCKLSMSTVDFFCPLNKCLTLLGCRNWRERLLLGEGPQQPGEQDGDRRSQRAGDMQHGWYTALHQHQQDGVQVGVITCSWADNGYDMNLVGIVLFCILSSKDNGSQSLQGSGLGENTFLSFELSFIMTVGNTWICLRLVICSFLILLLHCHKCMGRTCIYTHFFVIHNTKKNVLTCIKVNVLVVHAWKMAFQKIKYKN